MGSGVKNEVRVAVQPDKWISLSLKISNIASHMPSKIQLDENLWFLYICLQKSDLKSIDFTAVGASTNLKPPAARMRYTRLRRQIESGTLIGTHGIPFPSDKVVEKNAEAGKKRKRLSPGKAGRSDAEEDTVEKDESKKRMKRQSMIKKEEDGSEGFESSGKSDSDFEDSEDDMPLAKLMKSTAKAPGGSPNHVSEHSNMIDISGPQRSWAWE